MHPLHNSLANRLSELLTKHRIVLVYDRRQHFAPFFDQELETTGTGEDGRPCITVGDTVAFLLKYERSFFALRRQLEPLVNRPRPPCILVYLPGVSPEQDGQLRRAHRSDLPEEVVPNLLLELQLGGKAYQPQLGGLARNLLRKRYTDGQIDTMLKGDNLTYADVVSFLQQADEGEAASVLRTIFHGAPSEQLLVRWLAEPSFDAQIMAKDALEELVGLLHARLGLELPTDVDIVSARRKTWQYLLVGEFRADLQCAPPATVAMVPAPAGADPLERLREVVHRLRNEHPEAYMEQADELEATMALKDAELDAACLGTIDTFRFEESALLQHAGTLVAEKKFARAMEIVVDRRRSFWVDRDLGRHAQWEACRMMAELGLEVERVSAALPGPGSHPEHWIQQYAAPDGWHRADGHHRRLESWIAGMDDEPESHQALNVVRRAHEALLSRMARGFTEALRAAGWSASARDLLHQTHIYPELVKPISGTVAWFWVDALRFEMGVELAALLGGAEQLELKPAAAALPTVTPVGMAALLPGASSSFSVVDQGEKLGAAIEGSILTNLAERRKFLKSRLPGALDLTLGNLLSARLAGLKKQLQDRSLVVVRSQEIDFVGEADGDMLARQVMDTIIGNLARAVKKLAAAGVQHFVITSDHGHQFGLRKEDDMKMDKPGGQTVELHRRFWAGHGGETPSGALRVSGAELGYDTHLDFVFPSGLGVFKAGGGLAFHHGSTSLQELVIPVLTLRFPEQPERGPAVLPHLESLPETVTTRTIGFKLRLIGDLFLQEVALRVVLLEGNEVVGKVGMVLDGNLDKETGILRMSPGGLATVGMMLIRDCKSVKVVVQDAHTDAVLTQSDEIPVTLGL